MTSPRIKLYEPTESPQSHWRCIDLFAGAGGLAVGFRQAGWSITAANDFDAAACDTFRQNFPETVFFEGPITDLTADAIIGATGIRRGELDVLIGGPPCQSFSYNNHHRSADDERARLFKSYLDLVAGLNPKCLVMENVPGMLTIGGGAIVDEIRDCLRNLNFDCTVELLSAEEFGTPQVRKRVFVLASRVGPAKELIPNVTHRSVKKLNVKGSNLPRPVTVQQAIGDLPEIENGGGLHVSSYGGRSPKSNFQKQVRDGSKKLFNHVCHKLTSVNLDRMVHVPEGGNWRDIPFELLTAGMQRAKPTDHTKRYGRLDRKGLAATLLTKCDPHWGAYVHPSQLRTISVREAARLQGFPDTFHFAGQKLGPHYEQVGNAVPVPVAQAIGVSVREHLINYMHSSNKVAAE